ncbi:MAG: hypothetical protein ACYDBJ_17530 [Aggregatilineales bacterium]
MTDAIAALIQTHAGRYPVLEVIDIYRLLHQAAFGVGGRIPNRKTAREWLDHEAKLSLHGMGNGLLVESVHPESAVVRLYLQPYQAAGGSLAALLDAHIKSSETAPGDPPIMAAWWAAFAELVASGGTLAGRFEPRLVALTGRVRANEHWPASAHSPIYLAHYQPYYRVLTRDQAETLLKQQGIPFRISA